jgi:hypothetical protein
MTKNRLLLAFSLVLMVFALIGIFRISAAGFFCKADKKTFEADGSSDPDFASSEQYLKLVKSAERGDVDSINKLIGYYYEEKNSDLRNLQYWSEKGYVIGDSYAYTNYILALAAYGQCPEAWKYLEKSHRNRSDFEFYGNNGKSEYIISANSTGNRCVRRI